MSFQKARYALWNHPSMHIRQPIEWRETPKSKDLIAVVPPTVLPGHVLVVESNNNSVHVQIDAAQQKKIKFWMRNLPDNVMLPTALSTQVITNNSLCACFDHAYCATQEAPQVNEMVRVRLVCYVTKIGAMRKTQLVVSDVLRDGVAT